MKVELRVAKVLAAERVPVEQADQDPGGRRQRAADARRRHRGSVSPGLIGRTVVMVFNLKPAKLMGVESNGMILAASPEGGKPMLVGFENPPDPGTRVR